jgi:hypothetical protein
MVRQAHHERACFLFEIGHSKKLNALAEFYRYKRQKIKMLHGNIFFMQQAKL